MIQLLKDFISYGVIAIVFLIMPYNETMFITLIVMLICDLIHLYILERKEEA